MICLILYFYQHNYNKPMSSRIIKTITIDIPMMLMLLNSSSICTNFLSSSSQIIWSQRHILLFTLILHYGIGVFIALHIFIKMSLMSSILPFNFVSSITTSGSYSEPNFFNIARFDSNCVLVLFNLSSVLLNESL